MFQARRSARYGQTLMHIGVLDDDPAQLGAISRVCQELGNTVSKAKSAAALKALLGRETIDLLILDWMLPESSGIEVIEWCKHNLKPLPPILMVTSRDDQEDIVHGLQAGADDYVTKPIIEPVLAARIGALLRRAYPAPAREHEERHGRYLFRPAARSVIFCDQEVTLSDKEMALSLILFRNVNRALSRAYILDSVPGWNPGLSSRTLDIHISKVRGKLKLRASEGFRISSIYGYGYRMEAVDTGRGGVTSA